MARPKHQHRKFLRVLQSSEDKRTCGGCDACCESLGIADEGFFKPPHTRCSYQAGEGKGCSIYADRPWSCREWVCAWKLGLPGFKGSQRPDRFGVLAWLYTHEGVGYYVVQACRGHEGALERLDVKAWLREISMDLAVVIMQTPSTGEGEVMRHGRLAGSIDFGAHVTVDEAEAHTAAMRRKAEGTA